MASKAPGDRKKKPPPSSSVAAITKKKKDKPSSSSKDKTKTKSSAKKSKSAAPQPAATAAPKADEVPPTAATAATLLPISHDPDAVQLFRRYDRARAGVLTRLDFLQLLKDYANPPAAIDASGGSGSSSLHDTAVLNARRAALQCARKPLSLTDTSGIPLGYERSDKNSEFEAGQLFERYDKDRTGALTLDKFHGFFADFKPQLTAFVEDLNYYLIPHPAAIVPSDSPSTVKPLKHQDSSATSSSIADATSVPQVNNKSEVERRKTLKSKCQMALWKLRKLCQEELFEQRERILETMTSIQDTVAGQQRRKRQTISPDRWQQRGRFEYRDLKNRNNLSAVLRWTNYEESENQAVELYESMEEDLERIDEIEAYVRRCLKEGGDASSNDMEDFLAKASELQEQAHYLVMKDYAIPKSLVTKLDKNASPGRQQRASNSLSPTHSTSSKMKKAGADHTVSPSKHLQPSDGSVMTNLELNQLLHVKDQMIYQLLLERTEMRKQKASMESYLQELSEVSTAEMKKWARLTDEMQVEIELLRSQVNRKTSSERSKIRYARRANTLVKRPNFIEHSALAHRSTESPKRRITGYANNHRAKPPRRCGCARIASSVRLSVADRFAAQREKRAGAAARWQVRPTASRMAVQNKVYASNTGITPCAPPLGQARTISSSSSSLRALADTAAAAPGMPASKYRPDALKSAGSNSSIDRSKRQRPGGLDATLIRSPWWLFQRYVTRPLHRKYKKLSWTTRTTISVAVSLSTVLYVIITVPFRIGFLYNPFGSLEKNVKWTRELEILLPMDVVFDAIGLVEFIEFYRVWRDAFSQLSESVSFELGKKMSRDARSKSPKITQRARKTSSVMRSTKAKWTLTALAPSATSVAAANKNYQEKKLQFIFEIIAILPLEVIPLATGQLNALHLVRFTKLCRMYRLRQCLDRIGKVYSESAFVQQLSYTGISGLVKRIGLGATLCHWFACGYMFIAHTQCGVFFEFCSLDKQTSWVIRDQLPGSTLIRQYGRSLYWASRTMVLLGYDDVTPVSDAETFYAIIVQVVGALLSTSILATFQFIFRYRNSRQAAFSAHVDNAREYMKSQNIPRAVRRKVMNYFSYAWNTHHGLDSEDALRLMPKHLQSKVIYTLKASRVKQVCFLMKESVEFINHLALALFHGVYSPDDSIIEPKMNAKMFFVIRGTVVLSAFDGSGSKECQTGDFFADCCLLAPEKYEEKAVAKTFCELYVLDKSKLDAAISHFYRGREKETLDRMADTFEKYSTQLRKTKKLLGLRGGGGDGGVNGSSGSSGSDFARLGIVWRLPSSTFRVSWDVLRFLGIIYVAFEVPYYIVFISNHDAQRNFLVGEEIGARYAATLVVELLFMADIILRARFFAYLDPTVMLNVVDSEMIFAAYKANGFYLDLFAVVPISLIMETIQRSVEDYSWIFRVGRLFRLRYMLELIQDLGDYYGMSSKFQLVATLLLGVTLTLHVTGCIWFVMAWMPLSWNDSRVSDTVTASEITRETCLSMATNFQNCSWVKFDCYGHIGSVFPIKDSTSFYKASFAYLRSLYWAVVALTSVGYGDIVAFSTAESYFAALWIFIGGIINFGVVGAMSSTISNLMASQHHHVEKLNAVNNIMEHLHISEKLRVEIRRFYHNQFTGRKRGYESQLLSHLPDQLCYQISSLLHAEATKCISLFDSASREFLEEVTGKFRHRTYQNGETIVIEGDTCKEFFVILHGKVNEFFQSKKVPVGALHNGDCYGVNEFLLKRSHPTTLTAVSLIHASVMTREQFDAILLKFADDIRDIKIEAHQLWAEDMSRRRRIARNLENFKLQPHVLATTTMFYQKDSGHVNGVTGGGHGANRSHQARDPDALRMSIRNGWNVILTLCNIYNAFVIIFRIAFHSHMHMPAGLFTAMWLTDIACDLFFAADIYLKLYYFGCEEVNLDNLVYRKEIDTRYRKSNRLKLDLFASLPLYVIDSHHPLASGMCRLPRLLRCADLWTYLDNLIIQIQQAFASQNVSSYLSPLKLLFFLLLIAHYAASIFFWISDYECAQSEFCWLETDHFLHVYHHSIGSLYIRSFYWALTTLTLVGSREIVPRGSFGTLWAIITCLCCTFVMGHIVGELSDLIIDVNKEAKEHKSRIESFEHFAKEHDLPGVLRERVALFFKVQLEETHGRDVDETIHDLSANLKLKLKHEIYGAAIVSLPISRFLTYSQVNNLALRLSSDMFIPGDDIVVEDTLGSRLCIMRKGLAGVFWTESVTNVAVLIEGCLFGEVAFFLPQQRRIATVKAITSCEVLHISKHHWDELWATNSDASEIQVQKYALNSILDWVKDRLHRYQESCLKIATKTKHHMLTRKISENLSGMMAAPSKSHAPKLKRGRSFHTPESMILEKKAKYLLAKADVYVVKYHQYLAVLQAERATSQKSTKSFRMSKSIREIGPSRHNLPSLTPHQTPNKKKTPSKSLDLVFQQFFVEVNPVNKHVRGQIDDQHMNLLEMECWKRFAYLASVKNTVTEMMNELIPPQVCPHFQHHQATTASADAEMHGTKSSRRSSVLTRRHSRRLHAPIDTMKGPKLPRPLMKMHSIHSDAFGLQTLTPRLEGLNIHHQSHEQNQVPRLLPFSQAKVATDGSAVISPVNPRMLRFTQTLDMSSRNLLHAKSGGSDSAALLSRMMRCQSLPSFDNDFFERTKQHEEKARSVTRRASSGIESTLRGPVGIDFEILQRCKRPKFSTMFRWYRDYHRWSHGDAGAGQKHPSGASGTSTKSVHEQIKPRPGSSSFNQKVRSFAPRSSSVFSSRRRSSIRWQRALKRASQPNRNSDVNSEDFQALIKKVGKAWDLVMFLVALYYGVSVPFKVCFANDLVELPSTSLQAWSVMEYFLDVLCLLNLLRKVEQSHHFAKIVLLREKGEFEFLPALSLLRSVIFDCEFRSDIAALFPLELALFGMGLSLSSMEYPAKWKYLCFLRLNKILHATRIEPLSESLIQYAVYDLKVPIAEARLYFARALASYLTMGHYIACVWFATSEKAYHDYAYSWLSTSGMLVSTIDEASSGHSGAVDLTHVSLKRKYYRAMHFAIGSITTLFYGDIVSMNLIELFVEFTVILWSIYIYGTLVGAHGEMYQFHSRRKAVFEQNLSELQHYLVLNEVPKGLKKQVKQYYASIWRRRQGEEEFDAIASISRTLQEDVVYATLHRFAWKVSIFHALDVHFLRALLVRLTFVVCSESEEVVIRGDVDRSMYFISHGRILVKQDKCEVTKEQGEFFGELALLYGMPRHETCVALTTSELYRLDHDPYEALLLDFPEYRAKNKLEWTTAETTPTVLSELLHTLSMSAARTPGGSTKTLQSLVAIAASNDEEDILAARSSPKRGGGAAAAGIAEEEVPSCYVYRATMELLSQLNGLDALEAKHIITKGRNGARKYLKRVAGVETARDGADDDDELTDPDEDMGGSRSPRALESTNEVRNFDSVQYLGPLASDDEDHSAASTGRVEGGGRRALFKRGPSSVN